MSLRATARQSAVIFDLDGTILDNEDVYGQAFAQVLKELGATDVSESHHERGIGMKPNWAKLIDKYNVQTTMSLNEISKHTQEVYLSMLDQVRLRDGFEEHASDLQSRGVKLALATSNNRDITDLITRKFNLGRFFPVTVTADDVEKSKPDPETFLLAAEKLEVNPKDCHVYEDAQAGHKAAKRANMPSTHITKDYSFTSI